METYDFFDHYFERLYCSRSFDVHYVTGFGDVLLDNALFVEE